METGTVVAVKLDKGFGFIHASGRDIFFHVKDVADGLAFDETLRERRVEFNVVDTDKGPKAVAVRPAE
jgi:cold shock CspA family protein